MSVAENVLISDFDGTITAHDFFQRVIERLLQPSDVKPWLQYTSGKISHFEALAQIFAKIRASEAELEALLDSMELDDDFGNSVRKLQAAGWEVIIVSNGCNWYIERLLSRQQVELQVHSNPGRYLPSSGLMLSRPFESPFYGEETGIDKRMVVRQCLDDYRTVAFAGDGRPDLQPALLVPENLRFARGWLAQELESLDESYLPFKVWSEISHRLLGSNKQES